MNTQNKNNIFNWFDRIIVFSGCALIYFLPISIALTETFSAFVIFFFLIKKMVLFSYSFRESGIGEDKASFLGKITVSFKSLGFRHNPLNKPIIVFLLISLISIFISEYPALSVKAFFSKVLEGTLLCLSFLEAFSKKKYFKIFLLILFVSSLLICVNGLFQYISGKDFIRGILKDSGRISSSFRNANDFGAYLIIVIPIFLSFLFFWNKGHKRIKDNGEKPIFNFPFTPIGCVVTSILFLVNIVSLGLTYSRGAWLGLAVALLFLGRYKPKFMVIILIGYILFVGCFYKQLVDERGTLDYKTFLTSSGRLDYWREAWNVICDYPVFGTGLNTYSMMGSKYKISWGGYPHNCYLQMAAETGLAGLFSFLWLLWTLFYSSLKRILLILDPFLSSLLIGLLAGLLGFLTHSSLDTNFYSVQLGNLFWIMAGMVMAVQRLASDNAINLKQTTF